MDESSSDVGRVVGRVASYEELLRQDSGVTLRQYLDSNSEWTPDELVGLVMADQRVAWSRGIPRMLEEYLQEFPELLRVDSAVVDLIYAEIVLHEEYGRSYRWETYLGRFPEHREALSRQAQLHQMIVGAVGDTDVGDHSCETGVFAGRPQDPSGVPNLSGFEVISECGRGAIAVVYHARDLRLGRSVAIKVLAADLSVDSSEAERMRREAQVVAELDHEAIVKIHAVDTDHRGLPVLIMEFVDGGNLAQRLQNGPLPVEDAVELMIGVCEGVAAAHRAGLVHRDVKPANILLTRDARAKVSDFGLVRRQETSRHATATGTVIGTPAYMSPEQARGDQARIGPPADVYSLGAVLFEMLCGRPPFQAASSLDVLHDVMHEHAPPVRQFNARVPRAIEAICAKCLAKQPADRYATAGDLAADLRRFLNGELVEARPESALQRMSRWYGKNPRVAALTTALVVLLVGVAVGSTWVAFQLHRANIAETTAKQQAQRAQGQAVRDRQAAVDSLYSVVKNLYDDLAKNAGTLAAREELVETAIHGLERMTELGDDRTVAVAHERLGDLLALQGKTNEATKHYELSLAIAERLAKSSPTSKLTQMDLARVHSSMARFYQTHGGHSKARLHADAAHSLLIDLAKQFPQDAEVLRAVLVSYERQLDNLWGENKPAETVKLARQALGSLTRLQTVDPDGKHALVAAAAIYQRIGRAELNLGHPTEAAEAIDEATSYMQALISANPDDAQMQRNLALNYRFRAAIAVIRMNVDEATRLYQAALDILLELAQQDPEDVVYKRDIGDTYSLMVNAPLAKGDFARAAEFARNSLGVYRAILEASPGSSRMRATAAQVYIQLMRCQLGMDDWAAMVATGAEAREVVLTATRTEQEEATVASMLINMLRHCCEALEHYDGHRQLTADSPSAGILLSWLAYADARRGQVTGLSDGVRQAARRIKGAEDVETIDDLLRIAAAVSGYSSIELQSLQVAQINSLAMRYQTLCEDASAPETARAAMRQRVFDQLAIMREKYPAMYAQVTTYEPDTAWLRSRDEYRDWLRNPDAANGKP